MSEKFNVLQSAMASSERIFKLLDEPVAHRVAGGSRRRRPSPARGHIVFDHVWFAYNEPRRRAGLGAEGRVVRGPPGRARRHRRRDRIGQDDADQPAAAVLRRAARADHASTASTSASSISRELRGLFSLVLQDVHLFSGTIADNIRLGNAAITDEQVRQAARGGPRRSRSSSGCRAATRRRSPSAASTLSVGQKQLLSFARALAFDPRVLILDEATSSVDTETEMLIRDALDALMAGRTTIAIAHRLSTIQDMDKILVLHKGVLRESGTHQELLAERGIYFKLFELQYKSGAGRRASSRDFRPPTVGVLSGTTPEGLSLKSEGLQASLFLLAGATGSGRDGSAGSTSTSGASEDPLDEARRRRRGIPAEPQHGHVSRLAAEPQRLVAAPHVDVDLAALDLRTGVEDRCRCRRTCGSLMLKSITDPTAAAWDRRR